MDFTIKATLVAHQMLDYAITRKKKSSYFLSFKE
jgi:hypothetical protein